MKSYTPKEILRAAEIGEVSMIDANHIVSLLEEARRKIKNDWNCDKCTHSFTNPFDQYYCRKGFNIYTRTKTCNGKLYEQRK